MVGFGNFSVRGLGPFAFVWAVPANAWKEQKQEQSPFAKDLNAGYECFAFEGTGGCWGLQSRV